MGILISLTLSFLHIGKYSGFVSCFPLSSNIKTPRALSCVPSSPLRHATSSSHDVNSLTQLQHRIQAIIASSPVFAALPANSSTSDLQRLLDLGEDMKARLGTSTDPHIQTILDERVYGYYVPLYIWLHHVLHSRKQQMVDINKEFGPLIVGVSAPQGYGKTTLVGQLELCFAKQDMRCASLSLDDFYLSRDEQDSLAKRYPDNPLLQYRGNAGTHDVDLCMSTLTKLRQLKNGQRMPLPRYDKSLSNGRGDRSPPTEWSWISGPVDVILLGGWMLGFQPKSLADLGSLTRIHPGLQQVNSFLATFSPLYDEMDAWIILQVESPSVVYKWRLEAERTMRANGKPGLSDDQVKDFVDRFMPSYEAYLPKLYEDGPPTHTTAQKQCRPVMQVLINQDRKPMTATCY